MYRMPRYRNLWRVGFVNKKRGFPPHKLGAGVDFYIFCSRTRQMCTNYFLFVMLGILRRANKATNTKLTVGAEKQRIAAWGKFRFRMLRSQLASMYFVPCKRHLISREVTAMLSM